MNTNLILVFGSLRAHSPLGYNFNRCGPQKYIRTLTLDGWRLYSLGAYPTICRSDNPEDKLVVELHEVDDKTLARITAMELGASYHTVTIDLPEGPATMYAWTPEQCEALEKAGRLARGRRVESGDWV